jgi:DNA modification methylase
MPVVSVITGDCREILTSLPDESVNCCVTSPPYYGLRSYLPKDHPDKDKEIGVENSADIYVSDLASIFREVKRVLRKDGTCWINLGDSYANKSLLGIPWSVALALRADGWYIRSDIIWHKPNPMPENISDRPTKSHEYLFFLTKSPRYYYDSAAVREPAVEPDRQRNDRIGGATGHLVRHSLGGIMGASETRNRRSVWTINLEPFRGAHFSTFPSRLVKQCIKTGSPEGGTVLDPFGGSGTVGLVAATLGRNAVLIELHPSYSTMIKYRLSSIGILVE